MKTETRLNTILRAVTNLNHCRGRGNVTAVEVYLDGSGMAYRRGQYFSDVIRFRVESRPVGYRIFMLGTSRLVVPE